MILLFDALLWPNTGTASLIGKLFYSVSIMWSNVGITSPIGKWMLFGFILWTNTVTTLPIGISFHSIAPSCGLICVQHCPLCSHFTSGALLWPNTGTTLPIENHSILWLFPVLKYEYNIKRWKIILLTGSLLWSNTGTILPTGKLLYSLAPLCGQILYNIAHR